MENIVVNASKGYGYNYASLGDIVAQGYSVPKMKTGSENEKEYVYYYDAEIKEWIRGAEVVIPESKGMNKAQLYGSALTYARRYTTLMALQLACGDDKLIEDINADGTKKQPQTADNVDVKAIRDQMYQRSFNKNGEPKKVAFEQIAVTAKHLTSGERKWIVKQKNLASEEEITEDIAQWYLDFKASKQKEREANGISSSK